jgi:arylsulfatase A-like enzyme
MVGLSTASEGRATPAQRAGNRAGLVARGGAVALGWILHDLATCLVSGRPALALELLPGSLFAVLLGLVFGWTARWRPMVPLAVTLTAAAAVFPTVSSVDFTMHQSWLPRALFLMTLSFAVAGLAARLTGGRLSSVRLGLVLAVLACAAMSEYRVPTRAPQWAVVGPALLALPLAWFVAPGHWRRLTDVLLVALPLGWLLQAEWSYLSPSRPDLDPPARAASPDSPGVLLIVLDTVRADHLAPYGYELETTPLLDGWVREHFTVFDNARSTSSWTLPSHASLFTGLMPSEHGATHPGRFAQRIRDDVPTLAERFRDVGYQTAAICSNNVYLRPRFGIDRGYEHFDDRLSGVLHRQFPLAQLLGFRPRAGNLPYRDGRIITSRAVEWLSQTRRGGPFFLTLNYMDAHAPNMAPPPHDRMFSDEQKFDPLDGGLELQALLYDRELHHLDTHLDRLLRALQEQGVFDNTAILITADHGEGIGDHGFHKHGWTLYDALIRVPLYVKPAGGRLRERDDTDINGADVFRLALQLAGQPEEAELGRPVDGEWYVYEPGIGGWDEIYSHRDLTVDFVSWMDGTRKFIVSSKLEVEVYDLMLDPTEVTPLELAEVELEAAQRRAIDWWAAHPTELAAPNEDLDDATLARMRALGYLGTDE